MRSTGYRRWLAALLMLTLSACAEVAYYGQAANGHWQVLRLRRPLDQVLADPNTPLQLQQRLQTARAMRNFASTHLKLPDNGSYRSYADLGRRYVVQNIFAAPELSLEPRRWCFLLLGCVNYRGYFDTAAAQQLAQQLRAQGDDVYLAQIPAYSTLGWFDDPLLNTFIGWHSGRLAELLFHELTHQQLYIADDTTFNESFATTVGRLGARLWLNHHGSAQEQAIYERYLCHRQSFLALAIATKEELARLYASERSEETKRQSKHQILENFRVRYRNIKQQQWKGYSGYDDWFARDLNNAKLAALNTYTQLEPAFQVLFQQSGKDFSAFYQQVEALSELPRQTREVRLQALLAQANPAAPLCESYSTEPADSGY